MCVSPCLCSYTSYLFFAIIFLVVVVLGTAYYCCSSPLQLSITIIVHDSSPLARLHHGGADPDMLPDFLFSCCARELTWC